MFLKMLVQKASTLKFFIFRVENFKTLAFQIFQNAKFLLFFFRVYNEKTSTLKKFFRFLKM